MYTYLVMLFVILFIVFFGISEKELFKSLFHTVIFIIALWINIPCFVDISYIMNADNNMMYLPVKLSTEIGIFYIIFANAILCIVLNWQVKFLNKDLYTQREIKKQYDKFVDDAKELYIIGKNIDFLGNPKYEVQTERIVHLESKSKLLCEVTNDKKLRGLYRQICERGVGIKCYAESDNITNLKGQIKIDQKGYKKAMFVFKQDKKYEMIKIENQFLIAAILDKYLEVYNNASNP